MFKRLLRQDKVFIQGRDKKAAWTRAGGVVEN